MVYYVTTNWYNKCGHKILPRNTKFIATILRSAEQMCSRSLLVASSTEPRSCKTMRRAQRFSLTNIHRKMALRSLAICQLILIAPCYQLHAAARTLFSLSPPVLFRSSFFSIMKCLSPMLNIHRLRLKCDGTRAETRFRLSAQ